MIIKCDLENDITNYDKKVINFICATMTSFNCINHITTQSLFNHHNNSTHLKDESHYRKYVLPKVYETLIKK